MCLLIGITAIDRNPSRQWYGWVFVGIVTIIVAVWLFRTIRSIHSTWAATRKQPEGAKALGFYVVPLAAPRPVGRIQSALPLAGDVTNETTEESEL